MKPLHGEPAPDSEYSARAVLELILAAMEETDAGTRTLYEFAGDGLRQRAGSLADLRRTFSNELFVPLVGAKERLVVEFDQRNEVARALVRSGDASFLFSLARRAYGRHPGCWLVTAVARDQAGT